MAEFLGTHRINLLHGRIENAKFISDDGLIVFDTTIKTQGEVLAGIRPEQIVLGKHQEISLKGTAVLTEPIGLPTLSPSGLARMNLKYLRPKHLTSKTKLWPLSPFTMSTSSMIRVAVA